MPPHLVPKIAENGPSREARNRKKTEKNQKNSDFFTDDLRNRIFIDFWSLPDPLGKGKTMKNHGTVIKNQGFAIVEKSTLQDRFWYHFGALLGAFWTTFPIFRLFFRIQKTGEKSKGSQTGFGRKSGEPTHLNPSLFGPRGGKREG